MKVLVTGGCGFIGSALIRHLITHTDWHVVNLDSLTYAANPANLGTAATSPHYTHVQADVTDPAALANLFATHQPDGVLHLAAESHVDRSIDDPTIFVHTNILGTFQLLQATREYLGTLNFLRRAAFRFLHVSTDEIYGSLGTTDGPFTEADATNPRSPYAATKAAADHLLNAWHHTYGVPVLVTRGSNNYGPYQYPEKLIPLTIIRALTGQPVWLFGDGSQVRDWLHVDDHIRGILTVFAQGEVGQSYNLGGHHEATNLAVVTAIATLLDELAPRADGLSYTTQITHVTDRPGHDLRYALLTTRAGHLGWAPQTPFGQGLRTTVEWYLANRAWWQPHVAEVAHRMGLPTA